MYVEYVKDTNRAFDVNVLERPARANRDAEPRRDSYGRVIPAQYRKTMLVSDLHTEESNFGSLEF